MASAPVCTMPKKKNGKPKRDDKAVKIDRDLASKAKFIADSRGIPIADYLSPIIRPHIEKDFPRAVRQIDEKPPPD